MVEKEKGFVGFMCPVCGGAVGLSSAKGEVRRIRRGLTLPVPEEIMIPRCESCGETYLSAEDSKRIDVAVRERARKELCAQVRALVDALKRRHQTSVREIEKVCAVTPSYLSHVINGRKTPSMTLVRLLQAMANYPAEFLRHTRRVPDLGGRRELPSMNEGAVVIELPCSGAAWSHPVAFTQQNGRTAGNIERVA